jgi:hypothetical protein
LGRFGTVAIDGTKIAANASIDANHGKQWFDQRTTELVAEAEATDRDEDATAAGAVHAGQDRVPAELSDRTRRAERIRQGAQELKAELQRRARADEDRHAAAAARRQRSEQGQPVVGRIPNGPHRLPEARAHLAREIAAHQVKLDRYARLIAEGTQADGSPTGRDGGQHPGPAGTAGGAPRRDRRTSHRPGRPSVSFGREATTEVVVNVTDPQSRIMPTRKGFLQGYNAQVAVTGDQLIIAVRVGQSTNDQASFLPMMQAAHDAAAQITPSPAMPIT